MTLTRTICIYVFSLPFFATVGFFLSTAVVIAQDKNGGNDVTHVRDEAAQLSDRIGKVRESKARKVESFAILNRYIKEDFSNSVLNAHDIKNVRVTYKLFDRAGEEMSILYDDYIVILQGGGHASDITKEEALRDIQLKINNRQKKTRNTFMEMYNYIH